MKKEKTLIILKPDAMQRGLIGEILNRFERKGIKFVGLKMVKLSDVLLDKHYAQHKGKHFFEPTKQYMKKMPVIFGPDSLRKEPWSRIGKDSQSHGRV